MLFRSQAEFARIPLADGTLVARARQFSEDLLVVDLEPPAGRPATAATVPVSSARLVGPPVEPRIEALLSRMTLEEKAAQMQNAAPAIERLGVPAYDWWNEGLHGVARAGQATVFPQAIGLAAPHHRVDHRIGILQRQIDMAGGSTLEARNLAAQADMAELALHHPLQLQRRHRQLLQRITPELLKTAISPMRIHRLTQENRAFTFLGMTVNTMPGILF